MFLFLEEGLTRCLIFRSRLGFDCLDGETIAVFFGKEPIHVVRLSTPTVVSTNTTLGEVDVQGHEPPFDNIRHMPILFDAAFVKIFGQL